MSTVPSSPALSGMSWSGAPHRGNLSATAEQSSGRGAKIKPGSIKRIPGTPPSDRHRVSILGHLCITQAHQWAAARKDLVAEHNSDMAGATRHEMGPAAAHHSERISSGGETRLRVNPPRA
ncbi:hypothetical protein NDU88_005808 [Pleurodeles waltl]|uniref:Uncharacterized protein n=1 Tax=Pleurodeles waltl TaxID=8319 RepID=A0AAV7ME26_PLEWA|nr:hypothetical protein NDU88_005808 [Pleurodeles waltl]